MPLAGRIRNHLQDLDLVLLLDEILANPFDEFAPVDGLARKETIHIIVRLLQQQGFLFVKL